MESSSKGLLTQVTQFWNLLDDLAESNPESYQKFIQQQLKEGKKSINILKENKRQGF